MQRCCKSTSVQHCYCWMSLVPYTDPDSTSDLALHCISFKHNGIYIFLIRPTQCLEYHITEQNEPTKHLLRSKLQLNRRKRHYTKLLTGNLGKKQSKPSPEARQNKTKVWCKRQLSPPDHWVGKSPNTTHCSSQRSPKGLSEKRSGPNSKDLACFCGYCIPCLSLWFPGHNRLLPQLFPTFLHYFCT